MRVANGSLRPLRFVRPLTANQAIDQSSYPTAWRSLVHLLSFIVFFANTSGGKIAVHALWSRQRWILDVD